MPPTSSNRWPPPANEAGVHALRPFPVFGSVRQPTFPRQRLALHRGGTHASGAETRIADARHCRDRKSHRLSWRCRCRLAPPGRRTLLASTCDSDRRPLTRESKFRNYGRSGETKFSVSRFVYASRSWSHSFPPRNSPTLWLTASRCACLTGARAFPAMFAGSWRQLRSPAVQAGKFS